MQKQNLVLRLWELGEKEHGRLIWAILSTFIGVVGDTVLGRKKAIGWKMNVT